MAGTPTVSVIGAAAATTAPAALTSSSVRAMSPGASIVAEVVQLASG